MASEYIYKDRINCHTGLLEKSRLIKKDINWYVAEYKNELMESWFPWIAGTKEFLQLTEQDIKWAING